MSGQHETTEDHDHDRQGGSRRHPASRKEIGERGVGDRGIAGGLVGKPQRAPFWRFTFKNGGTITLMIAGADGGNVLGQHVGLLILDEAQKFRSQVVFFLSPGISLSFLAAGYSSGAGL